MFFALLLTVSMMSCNKEELFVESVAEVVDDSNEDTEETTEETTEDVEETTEVDASLPCDFTLDNVQPNSTVVINCVLDLQGQTVSLPANVTIDYEGGDIINGTLNFSDNSIIDGNLLNNTVIITGSTPILKDSTFDFIPSKWGIVEGQISDEVALNNKNILNDMFVKVKGLGVSTFKIDEMDAYFKVSKEQNVLPEWRRGDIFIPSDFTLEMTDNTHLRVQPNSYSFFVLLSVLEEQNVIIKGGNLHGDRDEHDYSSCGGDAWCQDSSLLTINGSKNVVIDGVNMIDSTADGILVAGIGFSYNPDYNPSHDVLIKNCVIDKSRRNNISLVNGHHIIVENCQILNAGIDTGNSIGTNPKAGIDIEALRSSDGNGGYIYYEIVKDVIIRGNIEKGSARSAIIVAIGDDTVIEDNDTEKGISYSLATGIKIRNNRITGVTEGALSSNAIGGGVGNTETTYNNEISGNTIKGYGTGITLYAKDAKVFDNIIENANTGIFVPDQIKNTQIYGNTITSTNTYSYGISSHTAIMENIEVNENNIDVTGPCISFIKVNENLTTGSDQVLVFNNSFNNSRSPVVSGSNGVVLSNNN